MFIGLPLPFFSVIFSAPEEDKVVGQGMIAGSPCIAGGK